MKKGQVVCVIETSKSAIEIEAPGEGQLAPSCRGGPGGRARRAHRGDRRDAAELAELQAARDAAPPLPAVPAGPSNVTRKAAELAAQHGIDPGTIEKTGFVTVEDVEALVAARAARGRRRRRTARGDLARRRDAAGRARARRDGRRGRPVFLE